MSGPLAIAAALLASGLGLALGSSTSASAATGVSVHLSSGFSTMNVKAGATFDKPGGIGLELRPQINIEMSSVNAAFDFFYQGRIGSNYGAVPLSRIGGGLYYYPWGLPLQTTVLDNGVTLTQNHFSPFLLGQFSFTSIAITDVQSTGVTVPFNGLAIGYQLGGGGEMPISQTWSLVVQFMYEGTLSGGSTSSSTSGVNTGALVYSAVSGTLGVAIHP